MEKDHYRIESVNRHCIREVKVTTSHDPKEWVRVRGESVSHYNLPGEPVLEPYWE